MQKTLLFLVGALSGVMLLILTSFVPPLFKEVMALVNNGAVINSTAIVVFFYLAMLGFAMYVSGHIFSAINKKVSKQFEQWLE